MKTQFLNAISHVPGLLASLLLPLALLSTFNLQLSTFAQGTAFTYQGRLNDTGQPANGLYDLQFTIYDAGTGGNLIAGPVTNSATGATNGLFLVTLDFGDAFDGNPRWLEIAARTNSGAAFSTLNPRQELTPTPYAILAGDVALANTNIARLNVPNTARAATGVPIVTSGFITGATVTSGGSGYTTAPGVSVNDISGSGASITTTVSNGAVVSLTVHNAGSGYSSNASLTIGAPPSTAYQIFASSNFFSGANYLTNANNVLAGNGAGLTNLNAWQLGGNSGTVPGPNFIGTADNQPLELRVNSQRVLRLEPNTNATINVLGGSPLNGLAPGLSGATIAGGGTVNYFGTGLALTNWIGSSFATISGGAGNYVETSSAGAIISGGFQNTNAAGAAAIGGGAGNTIQSGAGSSAIAGGQANTIQTNCSFCFIGPGYGNSIQYGAQYAIIGGGYRNATGEQYATIAGGQFNSIQNGGEACTVSGGWNNSIIGSQFEATIGGGYGNTAGGNVEVANYATIPGGYSNLVSGNFSFAAGHYAKATNSSAFVWSDGSVTTGSAVDNSVTFRASGGYRFLTGATNVGVSLAANSTAWATLSDRNAKKNFAPVNNKAVLDTLARVPVQRWNYQWEKDDAVPHLGPTAQDFKAAFYPGRDDTSITTLEFDGVELAAIQGLNQKLEEKDAALTRELEERDKQIQALQRRLEALEELLRATVPSK
jgi:hypothetical protein